MKKKIRECDLLPFLFEVTTIENGQATETSDLLDLLRLMKLIETVTAEAQSEPVFVIKVVPDDPHGGE